jgi:Low specificity phosphatase (HAD superfamily)
MKLENNLKVLCSKAGVDFDQLLSDLGVDSVFELSVYDIQTISEEYEIDMQTLLFHTVGLNAHLKAKLKKIKLLVLDVDGVMTDGGMYFTENGDQIKKYNTKDGLAIMQSIKNGMHIAIISSGFAAGMVQKEQICLVFNIASLREKRKSMC